MATKGKSGPKKAKKKHRFEDAADEQLANARETMTETATETSPESYVNQWNQLVSTTNWEKGRIICQWREALIADGAPQADYSDEAWANLVGGVTGQHVGRLRRVHQQFGQVWTEYPGLFWSHFQVAMDWNDAEMWLEGCVQNGWSVSRMRGARWEAHGAPDDLKPSDDDVIVAGMDEDVVAAPNDDTAMAAVRDPSGSDTDDAESEDAESSSESPTSAKRNKAAGEAVRRIARASRRRGRGVRAVQAGDPGPQTDRLAGDFSRRLARHARRAERAGQIARGRVRPSGFSPIRRCWRDNDW
jgi:hypothetical protein